jgi:hypothetical protein
MNPLTTTEKIQPHHRHRQAIVYIRQSEVVPVLGTVG